MLKNVLYFDSLYKCNSPLSFSIHSYQMGHTVLPTFVWLWIQSLSCWAGVMIIRGNPLWYTKLVLTTGLLLDSHCPKTLDLTYNTHLTNSPCFGKNSGWHGGCGVGGWGWWWQPNYCWKMWVAKKFIKYCRFSWHIHSLPSPCGSPL